MYTLWCRASGSSSWEFRGIQSESEKLAEQLFAMYRLAPGEAVQLRDPQGAVIAEREAALRPSDQQQRGAD